MEGGRNRETEREREGERERERILAFYKGLKSTVAV